MKNKLGWSVVRCSLKRFLFRDWVPDHPKQNTCDATKIDSVKDGYQELVESKASSILQEALAKSLVTHSNPPLTIDGKPNESWIAYQGYAYPDLTRAEIEAKHLTAIAEEEYIISAFLNGEEPRIVEHPHPNPQVKHDDGQMFIKLFNEWFVYSPGAYKK